MNIVVINGSPSGSRGVTAQYINYLQLKLPEHTFETLEVGRKIKVISRNRARGDAIMSKLTSADAIIWAFPVYKMLVPAQLKEFIEFLFAHRDRGRLEGIITTSVSSSAKFYDHTAHAYVHGISEDLGLKYIRGFSAEMRDLLDADKRADFAAFGEQFVWQVANQAPMIDTGYPRVQSSSPLLTEALPPAVPKSGHKRIVVVSDAGPDDHNLRYMIELFDRSVSHPVEVVELHQTKIKGGCLGCMKCGDGDPCVYKDAYAAAFEREKKADIVIHAGAVRDRYFSARFKEYMDRYFSNGHRFVSEGGLLGYLVSGPLTQLGPMRETLEANIELSHMHRLGIVSDENSDPQATIAAVQAMARAAERWVEAPWQVPPTFLGVGGHKVFRDIVYSHKGIMTADHRFYRDHGLYDYPQKDLLVRIFNRVMILLRLIPSFRRKLTKATPSQRIRPYKRVLEIEASGA